MSDPNEAVILTEIATEVLMNELKRRAVSGGMTVEELVAQAKENWQKAGEEADALKNLGHE